jgi:hypothetical protein
MKMKASLVIVVVTGGGPSFASHRDSMGFPPK